MFGMGLPEIMVVLVLALVILGPEKLPGMARTIGKGIRELRKATSDLRNTIDLADIRQDIKLQIDDNKRRPDPYAGLAEEEESWRASSGLSSTQDNAQSHEDAASAYEASLPDPPGAVETSFIEHPQPASREIDGATLAVRIPTAIPDPFTVHVTTIHTIAPHAQIIPVQGGIISLLAALDATTQDATTQITAAAIDIVTFPEAPGVTIHRTPIIEPPRALLGGVTAVPIHRTRAEETS